MLLAGLSLARIASRPSCKYDSASGITQSLQDLGQSSKNTQQGGIYLILLPLKSEWYTQYMNMLNKDTYIVIGASGSGKGTQVSLLKEYISKKDPSTPIFYVQTGAHFREFIKSDTYAAEIARKVQEKGGLLPSFLAMWIWSDLFVKNLTGNEHLILDGAPRTLTEAHHLDHAMKFFKRDNHTRLARSQSPFLLALPSTLSSPRLFQGYDAGASDR